MKKQNVFQAVLFAAVISSNGVAFAADGAVLTPQTRQGISYVTGGIGLDEREALLQARPDYNLRLSFAQKQSGEFVADVTVTILDSKGNSVFTASGTGPLFYANLAPGRYQVQVTPTGKQTLTQPASINKTGARELYFYWVAE